MSAVAMLIIAAFLGASPDEVTKCGPVPTGQPNVYCGGVDGGHPAWVCSPPPSWDRGAGWRWHADCVRDARPKAEISLVAVVFAMDNLVIQCRAGRTSR